MTHSVSITTLENFKIQNRPSAFVAILTVPKLVSPQDTTLRNVAGHKLFYAIVLNNHSPFSDATFQLF